MSAGDKPTLTEAVTQTIWSVLSGIHTCLPGRVEKYDHDKSLAEVKPMLRRKYVDDTIEEMPVIANVPVLWMRTSKAAIHLPLSSGDFVLLVFAERSLDAWLSEGGEVTPTDRRKFSLTDAVAIPGLYPFSEASPIDNNEDVIVRTDKAAVRIEPDGTVHLTGEAFKLGDTVKKLVNETFAARFDNHVHSVLTGGTPGAPTGTSSSPAALAGTGPVAVPSIPGPLTNLFADAVAVNELTSKTEAE